LQKKKKPQSCSVPFELSHDKTLEEVERASSQFLCIPTFVQTPKNAILFVYQACNGANASPKLAIQMHIICTATPASRKK
jgi:hypothetical protein